MKKFSIMAVALCLVFAMVLPAMAKSDLEISGHLRVRGFTYDNHAFSDSTGKTDSKMDSRFRTDLRINVSEELWVRGRFHAWSGGYTLGSVDAYTNTAATSMDRGWLAYKSPIGLLEVGRMGGGSWGLGFGDYDGDYDRVKLTTPLSDKFALILIYQNQVEQDYGTAVSDADVDTFYAAGNYAGEKITAGLLTVYSRSGASGTSVAIGGNGRFDKFALVPYFKANLGAISLMGELAYEFGKWDAGAGRTDMNLDAWTMNAEACGDHGKFGWELGWAYVGGQDITGSESDVTAGNLAYGGLGQDWDKFVYFTDTSGRALLNTWDWANPPSLTTANAATGGVNMWYLGANFKPMENLKLSVLFGNARALETDSTNWLGADYGNEADFKAKWTIVPNLDYYFNFGYVWAGDALATIKGVSRNDKTDAFKCYHKLQLNF